VDFTIEVTKSSGAAVVTLAGELGADTAPTFDSAIDGLCGEARSVMVDLKGLARLDGLGLSSLVQAFRRLRQYDCSMIVVAPPPAVRKVMTDSGVEDFMPVCHTIEEAIALSVLLHKRFTEVRGPTAGPSGPEGR
jgi:anti-anti-sigma factor